MRTASQAWRKRRTQDENERRAGAQSTSDGPTRVRAERAVSLGVSGDLFCLGPHTAISFAGLFTRGGLAPGCRDLNRSVVWRRRPTNGVGGAAAAFKSLLEEAAAYSRGFSGGCWASLLDQWLQEQIGVEGHSRSWWFRLRQAEPPAYRELDPLDRHPSPFIPAPHRSRLFYYTQSQCCMARCSFSSYGAFPFSLMILDLPHLQLWCRG